MLVSGKVIGRSQKSPLNWSEVWVDLESGKGPGGGMSWCHGPMDGGWVEVKIWRCTYTLLNRSWLNHFWLNFLNKFICCHLSRSGMDICINHYRIFNFADLLLYPQISKACAQKVLEDLMSLTWGRRKKSKKWTGQRSFFLLTLQMQGGIFLKNESQGFQKFSKLE